VFATAGWDDFSLATDAGQVATSYYAEVLEGAPLDFGLGLVEDQAHGIGTPIFNTNTSGPLTGTISAYLTTPSTRAAVYTRNVNPFTVRVVISDQPTTSAPSATYCQYGTRLQANVGGNIILTAGIITAFMSRFGPAGAILAALIDSFVGRTLYVQALCGAPPPVMPAFTADDWLTGQPGIPSIQGLSKFWAGMQAAAWPYFCECVPAIGGGPAPTIYPDPVLDVPPSMPLLPGPFTCDNEDICTMLNGILQGLTGLSGQISQLRSDVTLIQRQSVPFAYVAGTLHSGLSGSGTIAVASVLGLAVHSTTIPGYLSSDMAPVASYFKLGEIALGTSNGYQARRIVTHEHHLFLDLDADMTIVAYLFEPGVVGDILELVREP
jgi:hypothetical protein